MPNLSARIFGTPFSEEFFAYGEFHSQEQMTKVVGLSPEKRQPLSKLSWFLLGIALL